MGVRSRRAFSLVELITVIGIVAILIAILLPVLHRVRQESLKVKCMNNLRQLVTAQMMYVSTSRAHLTYPNWGSAVGPTHCWTVGWLYTQGQTHLPLVQDDVRTGALFSYVNSTQVYHCPVHDVEGLAPERTDRLTSYIMNGAVCGYGAVGDQNADPVIWAPSYKITDWRNSSEQVLWWEAEENTAGDVDGLVAWNDGSSYPRENILSTRHGHGASIACFDGHVEWMDRIDFLSEMQRPGQNRLYCDPHRPGGGH
jgi:prepilin-type N-terminal cleavage/methylation domain-containing protein/prepilin-type processing-associated H-X9-DG protein